jgi:hypothetical protein
LKFTFTRNSLNVYKTASVQKRRWATRNEGGHAVPHIHGVVYDVANGELKQLEVTNSPKGIRSTLIPTGVCLQLNCQVNLQKEVGDLQECYNLYDFNRPFPPSSVAWHLACLSTATIFRHYLTVCPL